MAVQPESLEVLEKAQVAPAQARAIVRAIEIEIAGAKDTLATKHDVVDLGARLSGEMADLRAELRGEMADLRADLRGEMADLRSELRGEMATLRTEFRGDMSALRAEIKTDMAKLEVNLESKLGSNTRQMYAAILGQLAVLLGFTYFIGTHLR